MNRIKSAAIFCIYSIIICLAREPTNRTAVDTRVIIIRTASIKTTDHFIAPIITFWIDAYTITNIFFWSRLWFRLRLRGIISTFTVPIMSFNTVANSINNWVSWSIMPSFRIVSVIYETNFDKNCCRISVTNNAYPIIRFCTTIRQSKSLR